MARYIIGDVQGCYSSLRILLDKIDFVGGHDEVWFAGDLVNRGPDSLETLRWAVAQNVCSVLGNHDLYLLALAAGVAPRKQHTLNGILSAPDRDQLVDWLRHRPLMHMDSTQVMVHAGFNPQWSLEDAQEWSRKVELELRGPEWIHFLGDLFSGGDDALCTAANCLTRIRMCGADGRPHYGYTGPPEQAPAGLSPWFSQSRALGNGQTVYFGHWAALGHRLLPGAVSLDAGCVWGQQLIAICTDDGEVTRVSCADGDRYDP